jgi:phospholipid/cholesterol/gamma-HCH transport system substrate-binding protein
MTRSRRLLRFTFVIAALAALGVACAVYVLVKERLPIPFTATYDLKVELTAANGVQPGLGQPVNVAGVHVGTIVSQAPDAAGNALLTVEIQRSQLPRVYSDAHAALDPITPLGDMELNIDPGHPPAPALPPGATIGAGNTSVPVPLSDLLTTLDSDTRDFMTSMLASLQQGTNGRAEDLRRALVALGPTTADVHQITAALQTRQLALARLVHNLAAVTQASTQDRQLASLVVAGDRTLRAIASQDDPLQQAIAKLPGTVSVARTALADTASFSRVLGPTVSALLPSVARLPRTLGTLGRLSRVGTSTLSNDVRPLVSEAQPLVRDLAPATVDLRKLGPSATSVFQVLNYLLNELAYNPGGKDQGFLFWLSWVIHNSVSDLKFADAHGTMSRNSVVVNCAGETGTIGSGTLNSILYATLGIANACPAGN